MELWIRTQDKRKLINVKNLVIDTGRHTIYACEGMGSVIYQETLGTYKTKRRALEILDEIQEYMIMDKESGYEYEKYGCYQDCTCYKSDILMIYEMPKE